MLGLRKIGGVVLLAWAAIRFLPDLLESAQATVKYGRWVYLHLSAPQSTLFTIAIIGISVGLIFSESIQATLRVWTSKTDVPIGNEGPDIALDWESSGKNWDKVRLRNIGKESAFNITLDGFSWPELSFTVPVQINAIHPNAADTVIEPRFSERLPSGVSNVGRLSTDLRSPNYRDRQPLEVTVTFSDRHGRIFERNFVLEAGHGGTFGPEILVTPRQLKHKPRG